MILTDPALDEAFLSEIEKFIARHGIKPSRFGLDAMGDGALILQLKAGRSLSLKNVQRVMQYMQNHPAEAASPTGEA